MTECFPMSVIESMQYGIPCLVSDTSDVYRWSPTLKKYLTVSTIDSPLGIMDKIKGVLDNYDLIQKEIKSYLPALHQKVESSIEDFLK
jgi:glycosyltransferase involved in cell wall biosynthesis